MSTLQKFISLANSSWQNCNIPDGMLVRTCMQSSCTDKAPFISLQSCPATAAVCPGKTLWDSMLMAQIRLWLTRTLYLYHSWCTHETAYMRARTRLPRPSSLPAAGLIVTTSRRLSSRRRLQSFNTGDSGRPLPIWSATIARSQVLPSRRWPTGSLCSVNRASFEYFTGHLRWRSSKAKA